MPSFYTVDQIATLIDMHPKTIRRYIQDGKLKATKLGKQYRVANNDLNHFMGQQSPDENTNGDGDVDNATASLDYDHFESSSGDQPSIEVSSTLDIRGINGPMAEKMTQQITKTVHKNALSHADCIYYSNEAKLKVLLFGSVEFTDQMLKHINILLSQSQTSTHS